MKPVPAALLATLLLAAGCQASGEPPAPATAATATTGPALAPAEFRPPQPGSIIVAQRADGTLEKSRVVAANGFAVTLERDGEVLTRLPFCHACGDPRAYPIERDRYAALWPLEVGKSVTFRRRESHGSGSWIHTVSVTRTERVAAEVGTFDAYVVEEQARGVAGDPWRATRTQWYAPELGWTVRSEWQVADGEPGSSELAAIALAQ